MPAASTGFVEDTHELPAIHLDRPYGDGHSLLNGTSVMAAESIGKRLESGVRTLIFLARITMLTPS